MRTLGNKVTAHDLAASVGVPVIPATAPRRGTRVRVEGWSGRSAMRLVHIFPREGQEMVFEAPERAFRFFDGVRRRGMM